MKFIQHFLVLLLLIGGMTFGIRAWHQSEGGGRLLCDSGAIPEGHICLKDLYDRYDGDVLWIDARTETEWEKNSMTGSICLNPSADPARWDELIAEAMPQLMEASFSGKPIVVFCQSEACGASQQVAEQLRDPDVYALDGEIYVLHQGWQAIVRYPYSKLVD